MTTANVWFSRLLFLLAIFLASGILGLLLLAPRLDTSSPLLRLFAEDATVRRTSLASALGLLVTAQVYFRVRRYQPPQRKTPPGAVGA